MWIVEPLEIANQHGNGTGLWRLVATSTQTGMEYADESHYHRSRDGAIVCPQCQDTCRRATGMPTDDEWNSTPDVIDDRKNILLAAINMDWQQVVLNGGPPCFHLEGERFCGRAERWAGHHGEAPGHQFVGLIDLLAVAIGNIAIARKIKQEASRQ